MATSRLSFPAFGVGSCNGQTCSDTFVVCGGGGSSKSGVKNKIDVMCLKREERAMKPSLETSDSCDTGSDLVTSVALSPCMGMLACSVDGNVHVMQRGETFSTACSIQGDFHSECPTLNCVCWIADKLLATGGDDGCVRLWDVVRDEQDGSDASYTLELRVKLSGHSKEIKDIAPHGSGALIASASADQTCRIWSTKGGLSMQLLPANIGNGLTFQCCCFGAGAGATRLFTAQSPKKGRGAVFLVTFRCDSESFDIKSKWLIERTLQLSETLVTALVISPDGQYLGLGTANGYVLLKDEPSLQTIKRVQMHGLPVTGLAFVVAVPSIGSKNKSDATPTHLVSVSPDKSCGLMPVSQLPFFTIGKLLLMFIALVAMVLFLFWK